MNLLKCLLIIVTLPFLSISENIRGLSIFGLETEYKRNEGGGFMCSWVHPVDYYVNTASNLNFNLLRIPFSFDYIQRGNFNQLDYIIDLASQKKMKVIVDMHRIQPESQCPNPFCTGLTMTQFIQGWFIVLDRYKKNMNVIGHNAWNEYQGDDIDFLTNYTTELFQAVEDRYGDRYLHYVTGLLWSGTLEGISLEHLPFKDRIFYSTHKYPFSKGKDFTTYEEDWDRSMPFRLNDKLIIGEWGWSENDRWWAIKFIDYLKKRNITNTIWWATSTSGDTIDLFGDDCQTIHWEDYNILRTLWTDDRRYLRTGNNCSDCFGPIIFTNKNNNKT